MSTVRLRTGVEVHTGLYKTTVVTFNMLWITNPIAAWELVALAKDPSHQLFDDAAAVIAAAGLTVGGVLHRDVRAVILAAVECGDGLNLHRVAPLAE